MIVAKMKRCARGLSPGVLKRIAGKNMYIGARRVGKVFFFVRETTTTRREEPLKGRRGTKKFIV